MEHPPDSKDSKQSSFASLQEISSGLTVGDSVGEIVGVADGALEDAGLSVLLMLNILDVGIGVVLIMSDGVGDNVVSNSTGLEVVGSAGAIVGSREPLNDGRCD